MAYDIIIPENAQVPAYALLDAHAAAANDDAMFGATVGAPPRIKLAGKGFVLINEAGEETPYPPAKLAKGPDDNLYLPVIILKAKRSFTKTFYASSYNPNDAEHASPDCMSTDGEKPDAGVFAQQSELCATCPQNAFGTGMDQNGNPTKGKACTDTKMLACFVPGFGVYQLKVPPASLKNFGQFVRELTKRNYRVDAIITYVGFDLASDYPVLVFQFGGFVPEKSLPKLAEMAQAPEVDAIVNPMGMVSAAPRAIAATAQVIDDGAAVKAKEEAEAKAKAESAAKKKAEAAVKKKAEAEAKAAQASSANIDLGLDDGHPVAGGGMESAPPTDDELAAALGL